MSQFDDDEEADFWVPDGDIEELDQDAFFIDDEDDFDGRDRFNPGDF